MCAQIAAYSPMHAVDNFQLLFVVMVFIASLMSIKLSKI